MLLQRTFWVVFVLITGLAAANLHTVEGRPHRILLDTDVDTDDFFALLYILKLNRSEFDLEAITINANAWTDAGHAVNQIYDILYMMDRDDIPVGVGGEGGILEDGTILPNVGGYLPIIEQGNSTAGGCRYRQAIPLGLGGRLDIDTNYGVRKAFLPQVIHSGIPVTLVPLDATNTIPINEDFFETFENSQHTYEAQYCFQSLKMARDTWFDDQFYTSYFMWDSFTSGVAVSIMRNLHNQNGENEFAEMEYMNITVVTSNEPYGIYDGSNPFFDGRKVPVFNLKKGGVHSGHVQTDLRDPFCVVQNGKGRCQAIIVSPTGWANAATIDVVYDLLHMMGRDDIPVGLGDVFAFNQSEPIFSAVGDCKYVKAIPHGSGGFLDSDTLYGLARNLPRSPRRYTAENSAKFGAPRDTDHPELRQPLALEIWESVVQKLEPGSKISILTNGPLTNLAKIILSRKNSSSVIQDVSVVGGHISHGNLDKGNVLTIHSNEYTEMNIYLDPLAAKIVFESSLDITLIPLDAQRKTSSFSKILQKLRKTNRTPEALFALRLLSRLYRLQQTHHRYHHMDTFLGEILGAVVLAGDPLLNPILQIKPIKVLAEGVESKDGQIVVDEKQGKLVKILESVDPVVYYDVFAMQLGVKNQSAVVGSFEEQRRMWSSTKFLKS
ncbi:hypothetical protein GH714_002557 [Hevea brasiliensis]|uniref:Inosine/uridine-preferring nucleoside hydrolase domain-containing protein n=1 Tax=Hevea brasiliensis TaxID=3981 RepID=A0A6A6KJZ3_HEVBR|nr:hypothetical protein GH714_002557 [Hevea brasiliensis]